MAAKQSSEAISQKSELRFGRRKILVDEQTGPQQNAQTGPQQNAKNAEYFDFSSMFALSAYVFP